MVRKNLFCVLVLLLFSIPAFAGEITITVGDESKTFSSDVVRVLETDITDMATWIFTTVEDKYNEELDKIIIQETPYNPGKMDSIDKLLLIENVVLESAAERQARFEADLKAQSELEK